MSGFEQEPIEGLPGRLPEGERILWQGAPTWRYMARYVFRVYWLATYFAAFVLLRGVFALDDGASMTEAMLSGLAVVPVALLGLGIVVLLAWAHARTTRYTLTTRRLVLRYGIALPALVNLPFRAIVSASFRARKNGEGDLPVQVRGNPKGSEDSGPAYGPSYIQLWPHARPGRITYPEPMLRGVPDVAEVARQFAEALIRFREEEEASDQTHPSPDEQEGVKTLAMEGAR